MQKNSTSLCMITKDEEKNIEHCLKSIKNTVDEVIIVDTGSKDRTKEIAGKFCEKNKIRSKIVDFKWVDDFSKARNESLKHATKDWILVLDADEFVDEENAVKIKDAAKNDADAFIILQKNLTNDDSIAGFVIKEFKADGKKYKGWFGSLIVRLFRNKGYEFSGAVHELAEPSIKSKNGKIMKSGISIVNAGNSDSKARAEKMKAYLSLAKKKAAEEKTEQSYFELGILYKENNDFENSIKAMQKTVKINPRNDFAYFELGLLYNKIGDSKKSIKNFTACNQIKENANAFESLGIIYLKENKLEDSFKMLKKALELAPNKHSIYNNMGSLFEKGNNFKAAVNILVAGLKINPNNPTGFYNLAVVQDKMKRYDAAVPLYQKAVELGHKNKDKINKRVDELKRLLSNKVDYRFSFKAG